MRSLGDCVLTTPALAILKQSRPDVRIAIVVEDRFADVFVGNPDVDAILSPSVAEIARWQPDLCVNLHGGTRSMILTAASRARVRAGFAHHRGTSLYNVLIPTAQEILGVNRKVHTAEHLASALFYLGAAQIPVPRAKLFAQGISPVKPYAVVHAVAAAAEKTWRAEGFLAVARALAPDLEPVFIAGPGEDLSPFATYRCVAGAPLSQTKSLVQGASLFVGNDSGPAHMAAAFGVPVVVLFGPSDATIWAPWQVESRVLQNETDIRAIPDEQVLAAVASLQVTQ